MNIKNTIAVICSSALLISFNSCKSKKNVTEDVAVTTPTIKVNKLDDYYKNTIQYKSFSGKMSIGYNDGKMNQKASANIKMNKGKDVWLLASALGGMVEVARGYATPDSLKGMVGLTKTAYLMSFKEGVSKLGVNVDFESFQNLFIGNPILANAKIKSSKAEGNEVILSFSQDGYDLDIHYDKATGNIMKQYVENKSKNWKATLTYENYQGLADKQPFSLNRTIVISDNGKTIQTTIDFSKAEINVPADVTFRIPDNYKLGKL